VNQDGASNGLTAPNGPSQRRVIEAALANARLTSADVDVIEAHGTGTTLGDPIEAQALIATYGQNRSADRPVRIGSVKSNLGHTQAAAGAAGVMKAVLALQHGILPATLHADTASPHVDWSAGAVALLTEPERWPRGEQPRRVGVSSFGISGTNAHIIVEEAPEAEATTADVAEAAAQAASAEAEHREQNPHPALVSPVVPWVLSGRGAAALTAQAARLAEYADSDSADPDITPENVAWSLATSRAALPHRAVTVTADPSNVLRSFVDGEPSPWLVSGTVVGRSDAVFVFPGQGSQWVGMASGLSASSPVFAASIDACEAALSQFVDWSLTEVLSAGPEAGWFDRVDVVQPVLWTVMVSLAELWRSVGVVPAAVVGHSQGEIAAACVAGALSLEDGARVVALRSKAILALSGRGGMVSLALSADEAEALIAPYTGRISVAALNGPTATVVSGQADALDDLLAECEAAEVRARRVEVDYASHSAHVEELEAELAKVLAGITPRTSSVPFYSTLAGGLIDTAALDAGYWYRNLRERVRFAPVVAGLLAEGFGLFVEASAHPVLTVGIAECVEQAGVRAVAVGSLRREEGGPERFLLSAAQAWVSGASVDWRTVIPAGATRVDLPTYAFQRDRYWLESGSSRGGDPAAWGLTAVTHPLLGAVTRLAEGDECVISGRLSAATHPWLTDHTVAGRVLIAGTVFVELAVRAGDEVGCGLLEELTLEAPLVLGLAAVALQVHVGAADAAGRRELGVYSRTEGSGEENAWIRHAAGTLAESPAAGDDGFQASEWPPAGAEPVETDGFYAALAEAGYSYGPAFQGLRAVWTRDDEIFAEVELPVRPNARAGRDAAAVLLDRHHAFRQRCLGAARPDRPGGARRRERRRRRSCGPARCRRRVLHLSAVLTERSRRGACGPRRSVPDRLGPGASCRH
jgi:acyl transferase domain-containing protein